MSAPSVTPGSSRHINVASRQANRLLVVDPDREAAGRLVRILSSLGFGVDLADDCEAARKLVTQRHYTLGLISAPLPGIDSVTLYKELLTLHAGLVGALVVDRSHVSQVRNSKNSGINSILTKPVNLNEVIALVTSLHTQPAPLPQEAAVTEDSILSLTADEIRNQLTNSELIEIIRGVEYPFAGKDRLEYFDRDTLERVVHLVRRWCRVQHGLSEF